MKQDIRREEVDRDLGGRNELNYEYLEVPERGRDFVSEYMLYIEGLLNMQTGWKIIETAVIFYYSNSNLN